MRDAVRAEECGCRTAFCDDCKFVLFVCFFLTLFVFFLMWFICGTGVDLRVIKCLILK